MVAIIYPSYTPAVKTTEKGRVIFDEVRKQWVAFTPEEWVRQHFLQYLLQTLQYPASLLAIEKEIQLGELKKRCDIVVYNAQGKPLLLVECKSMDVALNQSVMEQALRYNIHLQVPFIVITNGEYTAAWQLTATGVLLLAQLPNWQQLTSTVK